MSEKSLNSAKILRQAGYRATPGRMRLLEILAQERQPLTIEQIHGRLGRSTINEVTLYRAVDALVSSGVLRRVDLQKGSSRHYELADRHHHHIVCTNCDRLEDFADKDCEELVRRAAAKSSRFRKITGHSIEILGLCNDCSASAR